MELAARNYYTGVGSRETPDDVGELFSDIAYFLESKGFILRSGAAPGADAFFERGVCENINKEIWVPWEGFNGSTSTLLPTPESSVLARKYHPIFDKLKDGAKLLHSRNCHQVLGADLNTPSKFLLCWTNGGEVVGGTATAIKLARDNNIQILNFGKYTTIKRMKEAFYDFIILNGVEI